MAISTIDSLQIVNQIIDLKRQVTQLKPDWHQYITPVVSVFAVIISLIIGLRSPKLSYKYNSNLESIKRKEEKQKDKEELLRKLYADVYEFQHALHIELDFLNHYSIEVNFFYYLSLIEKIEENKKSHLEQHNEANKKFDEAMKNAVIYNNKFMRSIAEYKKLMPESIIYSLVEDFNSVIYNYECRSHFSDIKTPEELDAIRVEHLTLARTYVKEQIIFKSNKIVECIEHDK